MEFYSIWKARAVFQVNTACKTRNLIKNLIWRTNGGATHSLQLKKQVILFPDEGDLLCFQALPLRFWFLQGFLQLHTLFFQSSYLLSHPSRFNKRLDLEEKPHPGPVLHSHESSDIPLDQKKCIPKSREKKEKQVNSNMSYFLNFRLLISTSF